MGGAGDGGARVARTGARGGAPGGGSRPQAQARGQGGGGAAAAAAVAAGMKWGAGEQAGAGMQRSSSSSSGGGSGGGSARQQSATSASATGRDTNNQANNRGLQRKLNAYQSVQLERAKAREERTAQLLARSAMSDQGESWAQRVPSPATVGGGSWAAPASGAGRKQSKNPVFF